MTLLALLACAEPTIGMIPGEAPLWEASALPVFELTFESDAWLDGLWADASPDDPCVEAPYQRIGVRFQNPATGETEEYADVGVRLRGNASLKAAAEGEELPGMKLSFSEFVEDRTLHGSKKINLLGSEGDFTLLREHLSLAVAREAGLPAPYNAFALVYVNGAFEGVHPYTEEPDDGAYVDNHFLGVDGSLYKASGYCGAISSDLVFIDDDPETYALDYVPKAGTDPEDMVDDLIPLLKCGASATDEAFAACIPDWLDVERALLLIAIDQLLPDVDGLVGRSHNYMLFYDRGWDRFVVYPWDKDQSFYLHELTAQTTPFDLDLVYDDEKKPPMVERLQRVFPDEYCEALRAIQALTDPVSFTPRAEALGQFLWDPVTLDPRYELTDWKYGVQALIDEQADRWRENEEAIAAACP